MMTKKKTPSIKWVRFTWAMPVLAMLLFAFAEPQYQYSNTETTNTDIATPETISQKTVKMIGLVLDEEGEPMPGVSVLIKGGTIGCVSDITGKFELEVPKDASIVMSFIGKKTIEDTYYGITSVNNNNGNKYGIFHRKYKMEDAVIVIDTKVPPPPPPAQKTKKESSIPPPPPPPPPGKTEKTKLKKGEKEKEVFFVVEDMPKYPGGQAKLAMYVQKMQKKIAVDKKVKGKAKVTFTVNAKGKVSDIKVVEKDNDDAAKGAYYIASEMQDWKPGKQRGKPVPVKYLLPVEFK